MTGSDCSGGVAFLLATCLRVAWGFLAASFCGAFASSCSLAGAGCVGAGGLGGAIGLGGTGIVEKPKAEMTTHAQRK